MNAPSKKLPGKVSIVTGASKGIGAAISKALAAEGASVVVNYASSQDAADQVVAEITASGGKAIAVRGDMSAKADIEHLFAETKAAFGQLDILVNNAGMYAMTPVGSITEEIFHKHFDLNVLGLILACQEAVDHFGPEGGVIVNVSSIVASLSPAGTVVYNATKGAVDAVTRTLSRELSPRKIRVNSINPGLIATEGTHAVGFVKDGQAVRTGTKLGQPEDIASIVVFLASPDSRWINGQTHYATGDLV
jgi:3-oxoacyl-[acyl-carrier protein] reductase